MLNGTVDCHSHLLYGVDDGVRTPEESLAVLEFLETLGVTEVWCTPHVMEDVANATADLKLRFDELNRRYKGGIKLHLAAEYMLDSLFRQRLEAGDLLTMDDDVVLVESSTVVPTYGFEELLEDMMSAGYRPMLAHPERYRFLDVRQCAKLHARGVLLQLNIASLTGYYGKTTREKAEEMLRKGMYSAYGSDCHREVVIKEQYLRPELKADILECLRRMNK